MSRRFAFLWPWRGAKFGVPAWAGAAPGGEAPSAGARGERHRYGSAVPSVAAAHEMPLTRAPLNRALRVVHIHGGAQRFRRLSEMGLCPGAELRVLSGGAHGPVLLQVGDTRLALGSGLAEAVVVVAAGDNPATAAD